MPEPAPAASRLRESYWLVRRYSEALAAPLSAEDCAVQSMPDASPVKWHLAHTSWFFESMILSARPDHRAFDPRYAYLFNSYYEGLGPRHPRPRRGMLTRPSLEAVMAYRAHVDAAMDALLQNLRDDAVEAQIVLGLHHEQQHQELILTDIKHAFFANPLLPAYSATERAGAGYQCRAPNGAIIPAGWRRSVIAATVSRLTTRRRVTR